MNDNITCPYCGKSFQATEAITHKIKEEVSQKFEREQKQIMWQKALSAAELKTKEKNNLEIKLLKDENEEKNKKLEELRRNELEIRKERLKLEEEKKELELKTQRTIDEERKKISEEAFKKAMEENRLKNLDYERKESSYLKQIEELKVKMQQGSQQSQGEVMEDELKKILSAEFPYDEVVDVPKGIRGADLIQIVKNNVGKKCGTILWESKRTKVWTEGWISKLKQDQREIKAELAIIITQVLPQEIVNFGIKDGIWIVDYKTVTGAAVALRNNLIELSSLRSANKGKEEKKEILWNYLTSVEFKQRVEAIYESYNNLREELQKEKDWFTKKWAREEKSIDRVKDNLLGMHGDLEGIVGKTLPELEQLKKLEAGE